VIHTSYRRGASPACIRNFGRVSGLSAILAGLIFAALPAQAQRVEKHFAVQNKPKITVRNSNGRIQVKAWTKNEVLVAWTNPSGVLSPNIYSVLLPFLIL